MDEYSSSTIQSLLNKGVTLPKVLQEILVRVIFHANMQMFERLDQVGVDI
jgi:hypothetical protein